VTGIILALAVAAAAPAAGVPQLIYCHMGECSWSKQTSNRTVRSMPTGTLRKLVAFQGVSTHRHDYPSRYRRSVRIRWGKAPGVDYVFCSTQQPALAFGEGSRWIAHALDLFAIAGYNTASAVIYLRACHGVDFYRSDIEKVLRGLGYRPGARSEQIELSAPDQLVDLPRRAEG
jgi:hypothetical protein